MKKISLNCANSYQLKFPLLYMVSLHIPLQLFLKSTNNCYFQTGIKDLRDPLPAALIFPSSAIFLSFLNLPLTLYPNFLVLPQASSFLKLPRKASNYTVPCNIAKSFSTRIWSTCFIFSFSAHLLPKDSLQRLFLYLLTACCCFITAKLFIHVQKLITFKRSH